MSRHRPVCETDSSVPQIFQVDAQLKSAVFMLICLTYDNELHAEREGNVPGILTAMDLSCLRQTS